MANTSSSLTQPQMALTRSVVDTETIKGYGICATKKRCLSKANEVSDQQKSIQNYDKNKDGVMNKYSDVAEKVIILKPLTRTHFKKLKRNSELKQVLENGILDHIIFADSKIGILRMKSKELVREFLRVFQIQREWFFPTTTASASPAKPKNSQICIWGTFSSDHVREEFEMEIRKDKAVCLWPEYSKSACLISYKTIHDCVKTMELHDTKVADETVYCHFL